VETAFAASDIDRRNVLVKINGWLTIFNTQMSNQKGILILTPFFSPNTGGVETHLDDLVEYLAKKSYRVYVLTYQPLMNNIQAQSIEKKPNLEIRRIKWFRGNLFCKLEPYPLLQFLYLVPRLLVSVIGFMLKHKNDIDVIHAQGISAAFIARIAKFLFRKKAVVSTHAVYGWLYDMRPGSFFAGIIKSIFNGFDWVLTLSKQSRSELIKIGVNPEKVAVYRHWVNQDLFKPLDKNSSKKELGYEGKFVVLFVGRLIRCKGIMTLLNVIEKNKDNERIAFVFIGEGPLSEKLAEAGTVDKRIFFLGRINNNNLPLHYNAADVVIMPSQYEEGFGRVVMEAVACGIPVVGSNKGGIPEALNSSVSVLVPPTVENLTMSIRKLYKDKLFYAALSNNCRDYALIHFSKKNVCLITKYYGQ